MYKFCSPLNFWLLLLLLAPSLVATNTVAAQQTIYFEVQWLGYPIGYARFEVFGTRECKPSLAENNLCDFYRYSINLSKLRNLIGRVIIISDVYLRKHDRELISNFTIIKTEQQRQEINIIRNEEVGLIVMSGSGEIQGLQFKLQPKIQTLASLPLTIWERRQLGLDSLPVILGKEIVNISFTVEKVGDQYVVKKDGKEYLIFTNLWEPEKIVVLPVIFLGVTLGDVAAYRLQK